MSNKNKNTLLVIVWYHILSILNLFYIISIKISFLFNHSHPVSRSFSPPLGTTITFTTTMAGYHNHCTSDTKTMTTTTTTTATTTTSNTTKTERWPTTATILIGIFLVFLSFFATYLLFTDRLHAAWERRRRRRHNIDDHTEKGSRCRHISSPWSTRGSVGQRRPSIGQRGPGVGQHQ